MTAHISTFCSGNRNNQVTEHKQRIRLPKRVAWPLIRHGASAPQVSIFPSENSLLCRLFCVFLTVSNVHDDCMLAVLHDEAVKDVFISFSSFVH